MAEVICEIKVGKPPEKPEVITADEKVEYNTQTLGFVYPEGIGLFDADIVPDSIAKATLHVFSARLDGNYVTNVKNTGMAPLLKTTLTHTLREATQNFNLFQNSTASVGRVKVNSAAAVSRDWSVTGVLNVLWALITIFFTGKARVVEEATVQALGFKKTLKKDLYLPVKSVGVAWD
jgi:hypothetical protein